MLVSRSHGRGTAFAGRRPPARVATTATLEPAGACRRYRNLSEASLLSGDRALYAEPRDDPAPREEMRGALGADEREQILVDDVAVDRAHSRRGWALDSRDEKHA